MDGFWKAYDDMMSKADPRVEGWFMMSNPWPSILLCIGYVILVQWILPKYMENKEPYSLKTVMLVYNFGMVLLSGYIFLQFGLNGWFTGYSFRCDLVDYSAKGLGMVHVCWWFYISKFIEFIDTIIFCLRKKFNQVSFLHVFHHGIMPASWWFGVKFVAGGFGTFHSLLNSFIHFMMYTYYGLAALGPQYQKYLWWKRYMTKMQITQFCLVCIHTIQLVFMKDCKYPMLFAYWIGAYALIFLVMFADFYVKAYQKSHASKATKNGVSNGVKKD